MHRIDLSVIHPTKSMRQEWVWCVQCENWVKRSACRRGEECPGAKGDD